MLAALPYPYWRGIADIRDIGGTRQFDDLHLKTNAYPQTHELPLAASYSTSRSSSRIIPLPKMAGRERLASLSMSQKPPAEGHCEHKRTGTAFPEVDERKVARYST